MIKNIGFYILLFLFAFSCKEKKEKQTNTHQVKVSVANGKTIPAGKPQTILVDETKLRKIPTGKPTVVATNTNIHIAGIHKIMVAGTPRVCSPGQDTFKLPKTVTAIDSSFIAGIPEVVIAKDAANKDQNPQNFSFFSKLQGLKHGTISCMLKDKAGNLWFGSYGGGVSKYDGKSFTHFTEKEGLSNNAVWSILQDKEGNLWFGSYGGGVSKYDGKSFTHFTEKEGLSNNAVYSILQDKAGNLWFGTYGGGVSKYDGNRVEAIERGEKIPLSEQQDLKKINGKLVKSFTHFTEKEGLSNNTVYSILQDMAGNIWFGTYGGVSKYDGKSFTHFTEKEGLSNNAVYSILQDKAGNFWFGTYGGVSKYDGKSFTHFTEKEGLSNNAVWSILQDKAENIWFGTNGGGVSKYDGKSFTHFTEKEGLSNNAVYSILQDMAGNLWFGTNGGVSKYDGKSFTHFTEKEGLSNKAVYSILQDMAGNIWFGTNGGVSKYDGKSFTHFTEKEGLSNNTVLSILQDKAENLWFGTNGGVSKYDGKSFTHFTEKEGLSNNAVWSILQDKAGNLWFGTDGGVSKYDGNCVDDIINGTNLYPHTQQDLKKNKKDLVKSFTHFTEKEGLINNAVYSILQDKVGNLWFGTNGGVSKYDGNCVDDITNGTNLYPHTQQDLKKNKKDLVKSFTHFTEKEGLSNNAVLSILQDKAGNLWFGTRFGLSKLAMVKLDDLNEKVKTKRVKEEDIFFKNYTYEDGFLGIGCYRNSICEATDGTIWVGANDRLTAYHPPAKEEESADKAVPIVQLTSLAMFNENVAWVTLEKKKDSTLTLGNGVDISNFEFDGVTKWYSLPEHLSLAYNNNFLTFNFIGITMMQPKKVKYQFKLEGIDGNWSALTSRTEAPYGNLPSGNYTFKVKAMNSEGYWSKTFNYSFVIRPPWWQTWWFRTLVVLLIVASVWYYIKSREKKLIAEKEKLERTVEERTAEVVEEKKIVEEQKEVVELQKNLIEEKHKEITDSINYAERIQRSFIATKEMLDENLNDYFVMFKPKDIVSGDFYWASKLNNGNFALVTADSTGHGVPGAIMSLLNVTSLEKAIETHTQPSEILNTTRNIIIERLKKDGSVAGGKDGMDASLTVYDFKNKKLIIAAANNPVWIVRGTETIEIKPDKMPVGKYDKDNISFTQQEVDLLKGDVIYTLTDGFPDQFGGEKGKKFMSKNLRELLASNAALPMHEQKELLEQTFTSWVGNLEQIDDVTLIGVRI